MEYQLQQHYPGVPFAGQSVPYVLVVVDCQPGFKAARDQWLREAVLAEVRQACDVGAPVAVLEMSPGANLDTWPELLMPLRQHPHMKVSKYRPDGSAAVEAACRAGKFPTSRFRICGVNTEACVAFTARGLVTRIPDCHVEIATGACNCEWDPNPWESVMSAIRRLAPQDAQRCRLLWQPSPKNRFKPEGI